MHFALSYIYVGQKEVYIGASDFDIKPQLDYDPKPLSAIGSPELYPTRFWKISTVGGYTTSLGKICLTSLTMRKYFP